MLVLAAFAIAFILPLALLFLTASGTELSKTSVAQAKISARAIADEAGEVYLQGPGAKKTILVNYPQGVLNASVDSGLVILTLDSDGRRMDVIGSTFADLRGDLSGKRTAGLQKISLEYNGTGQFVHVSYG